MLKNLKKEMGSLNECSTFDNNNNNLSNFDNNLNIKERINIYENSESNEHNTAHSNNSNSANTSLSNNSPLYKRDEINTENELNDQISQCNEDEDVMNSNEELDLNDNYSDNLRRRLYTNNKLTNGTKSSPLNMCYNDANNNLNQTINDSNNDNTSIKMSSLINRDDDDSSNIVITPDIADYSNYHEEDNLDEQLNIRNDCLLEDGEEDSDSVLLTDVKDDRDGCRSLICDSNGIIIAEMVYRCMICANIADSIAEARLHYQLKHIPLSANLNNNSNSLINYHNLKSNTINTTRNLNNTLNQLKRRELQQQQNQKVQRMQKIQQLRIQQQHFEQQYQLQTLQQKQKIQKLNQQRTLIHQRLQNQLQQQQRLEQLKQQQQHFNETAQSQICNTDTFSQQVTNYNSIPELNTLLLNPPLPGTVAKTSPSTHGSRGGFVTCAVCSITKFYASVQRRYGQFTCMGCAKFFGRFLAKPKKFNCPNLGSCALNISPRCKACLLLACINTYTIDEKRKVVVNANRPVQRPGPSGPLIGRSNGSTGNQLMSNN